MRKVLLILILIALVVWMEPLAWGADTAQVSCTVTAQNIAVSISDGSIAYGTIALNSSESTLDLSDTQTVSNDGNVAENFSVEGADASGSSVTWTLSTAPGSDAFEHEFSNDGGTGWTALTTSYQTLASNIAASATTSLDLRIDMPTATTDYSEHSTTVTVMASAS